MPRGGACRPSVRMPPPQHGWGGVFIFCHPAIDRAAKSACPPSRPMAPLRDKPLKPAARRAMIAQQGHQEFPQVMKIDFRWAVAALALTAAGCGKQDATDNAAAAGNASAAATAPAGKDWTETVVKTPEGGFRMGNPDAPVKLVEYASLTCPHCADFSEHGVPKLREDYVRTGKVSWEFRTFVLNPVDVSISLLARCQGEGPFFKLVEQTYAEQKNWAPNISKISNAEITRIQGLPESQQFGALATAAGMDEFFRARGLSKEKADQCLADKAGLDQILAIRERGANQDKITGTPSFLINGKLAEGVYDFNSLSAALNTALGG